MSIYAVRVIERTQWLGHGRWSKTVALWNERVEATGKQDAINQVRQHYRQPKFTTGKAWKVS